MWKYNSIFAKGRVVFIIVAVYLDEACLLGFLIRQFFVGYVNIAGMMNVYSKSLIIWISINILLSHE